MELNAAFVTKLLLDLKHAVSFLSDLRQYAGVYCIHKTKEHWEYF